MTSVSSCHILFCVTFNVQQSYFYRRDWEKVKPVWNNERSLDDKYIYNNDQVMVTQRPTFSTLINISTGRAFTRGLLTCPKDVLLDYRVEYFSHTHIIFTAPPWGASIASEGSWDTSLVACKTCRIITFWYLSKNWSIYNNRHSKLALNSRKMCYIKIVVSGLNSDFLYMGGGQWSPGIFIKRPPLFKEFDYKLPLLLQIMGLFLVW